MNKERIEMQSTITPASAQGDTLPQVKADMLVLIDLIAEKSREVKLINHDELFKGFIERASTAQVPEVEELVQEADKNIDEVLGRDKDTKTVVRFRSKKEMKEHADEVPSQKAQREAFSRREMIKNLLAGNVASVLAAAEAQEAQAAAQKEDQPCREITFEYFEEVLDQVLQGEYGIGSLESWDHVTYYHYRPLLSGSYARILSAENNPLEQMVDMVRESSRVYPRPVVLGVFEEPPFNFSPETIQEMLQIITKDPEKQDIRYTTSSLGTVFLYSNKYMEDAYADFLAEEQDVASVMNP